MSPLYLYAVLAEAPSGPPLRGLAGEPLRFVACEGVVAAVGELPEAPPLEASALAGHDAAVRRLASATPGLLPARFGTVAEDEGGLREGLRERVPALRDALEAVRGCEQMTLRFSSKDGAPAPEASAPGPEAGPGRRYLEARREAVGDARRLPEVARVLDALAPLVRGERLERHQRPPLVASAYHLVPRERVEEYRAALAAVAETPALRVTVSGPWPPYAFAPGAME
jgi:hypothetical protein